MTEPIRSFVAPVEHGCLILRDENSKTPHDDWDPALRPYQVKAESTIFSVQPAVEGPVKVAIYREVAPDSGSNRFFDASVNVSRGRVIIHDPNDDVSMTFRVKSGLNNYTVFVDDVEFPQTIDIVFR
jgi:hypothetical protein